MERNETEAPGSQAQRLCSEIQLFDLCELERCGHKSGRFCSNADLLARFERISEEDAPYRIEPDCERSGDDDEECGCGYDDEYGERCQEEDEDRWED